MSIFDDAISRRIHRDEMGEALDEAQTRRELEYLDHALTQRPAEVARLVYALAKVGKDGGRTRIADLERYALRERGAPATLREDVRGSWVGGIVRGAAGLACLYGFIMTVGLLTPKDQATKDAAMVAIMALAAGLATLWWVGPRAD